MTPLQAAQKAPPAPASAPVLAQGTAPSASLVVPQTAADVDAIKARRAELSTQLNSATLRRNEVAKQLLKTTDAGRSGLEQRLAVLDNRIAQLELDIAETGRQLSSAGSLIAGTEPPRAFGMLNAGQTTAISIVFTVFVLAPLAWAFARRMARRATLPTPSLAGADAERMARMEQAIDAIAIEIERVSEGQRFTTQLLSDQQRALQAAPVQPINVAEKDAVPVARSDR